MKSPVYNVIAAPLEKVRANAYNPNAVAPPEMKLLELSIWEDGFTMPVVCYYLPEEGTYEIVDGFHRFTVLKTSERLREREGSMLPVVVIDKDISNRMASTIRHNRARGTHSIDLMVNIVSDPLYLRSLIERTGLSQRQCAKEIGISERNMRSHLTIEGKQSPASYPIQFALECLAEDIERK
jgi:ParB-like chromosome segregation protein Spo0J